MDVWRGLYLKHALQECPITDWLSWCLHNIRADSCISVAGPDRLVWPCSFVLSSVYSSVRVSFWLLVRRLSCGWGFRIFPTKPPIGLTWNLVVEWNMLCKELTRPDEIIHQLFVYIWVVHPNSRAHSFRAVKLPWIFPGAAWNFSGTPANIQGNLRGMQFGFYYPRPVLAFGYCRCLRPSVRPSVSPSVTKFVRAITHHPFKLGSLNLDHRCKRPWLRSLLFLGVIDPDLQGQI